MRTLIVYFAIVGGFVLSSPIFAKDTHQQHCIFLGGAFEFAAQMRNEGLSPQEALGPMRASYWQHIKLKIIKNIINSVYFDRSLAQASPSQLQYAAIQICMGKKPYKPLK